MIIDMIQTKVERQIASLSCIIQGEAVLVPTFEMYEQFSLNLKTGRIKHRVDILAGKNNDN